MEARGSLMNLLTGLYKYYESVLLAWCSVSDFFFLRATVKAQFSFFLFFSFFFLCCPMILKTEQTTLKLKKSHFFFRNNQDYVKR